MADHTLPATDIHNQPADQKLINEHPDMLDDSLRGQVPGPMPAAPAPAAPAVGPAAPNPVPASERAAVPSSVPKGSTPTGTDSTGHPRPHGQAGSATERTQVGNARKDETAQRTGQASKKR